MNIQEYISSGIVESYVLGLADAAERAEFEQMCVVHPEVRAAREAFEVQLEQHAMAHAVAVPAMVRQQVWNEIAVTPAPKDDSVSSGELPAARVIALPWVRYVAAAAIILLLASAGLNFYFFNKYREYSSRYDQLLAQQTELVKSNNAIQTKLGLYENTIARLTDTNMAVIKMAGSSVPNGSPEPASVATVYWDTISKDVYLMVNNLPAPPTGKQYQLWAIVDGQPVDAGVFDMDRNVFVKMKNVPRAQLFAITLEQKGGSPTPQGRMYVLGKA